MLDKHIARWKLPGADPGRERKRHSRPSCGMTRRAHRFGMIGGLALAIGFAATAPGSGDAAVFFAPFVSFGTGANPNSTAIGDLNQDGKPDLVTANYNSNTVSVLLGHGDG